MSIRRACSLLLTRSNGDVYLARRADALRFFGGFWAFPGGAVDRGDDEAASLAAGADPTAQSWMVAAAREGFEELGIALFRPMPPDLDGLRQRVLDDPATFAQTLRAQGGAVSTSRFSRLIRLLTPAFSPVRFDTVFYAVHIEEDEDPQPSIWPGELVDGAWNAPEHWLRRWRAGELLIAPPVLLMLQLLARHGLDGAREPLAELETGFETGRIHPIYFNPAVQLLPLRTPTLPPATRTNAYAVGTDPCYLIDPSTPHDDERAHLMNAVAEIESSGRHLRAILLTHHHPDHVGATNFVVERTGLPVHAHPITRELLQGSVTVDFDLEDGQRLPLGTAPDGTEDWQLEVFHTPGHAPGHLCFFESVYGSLIAGDMMSTLSSILIHPDDGDMAQYVASLERLIELPSLMVYPSHGPATQRGASALREQLEHRRQREEAVLAAVHGGSDAIGGIVRAVYGDVPEAMHDYAALSVSSILSKLASEGRVEWEGDVVHPPR